MINKIDQLDVLILFPLCVCVSVCMGVGKSKSLTSGCDCVTDFIFSNDKAGRGLTQF